MTTASDNFNRANESPVAAPWTSVIGGGANLASNALTSTATTDRRSFYSGTWGNDQIAHVIVGNLTSGVNYAAVCVRMATTGGGRGYEVYTDGASGAGHTEIARWDAGAATVLANIATTFANGDKLSIRAQGTTLTVYKNDVQVAQLTGQTTYGDGAPGCGAYQSGTVDDFSADDGGSAIVLEGSAVAAAAATGALTTGIQLAAAAAALATAVGNINAALAAAAQAQAQATGDINPNLAGAAQAQAAASGSLGGTQLQAAAAAVAAAAGTLTGVAAALQGSAAAQASASATFSDRRLRKVLVFLDGTPDGAPLANKTGLYGAWWPSIAAFQSGSAPSVVWTNKTTDANGQLLIDAPGLSVGNDQGFGIVCDLDATPDDIEGGYIGSFDVI